MTDKPQTKSFAQRARSGILTWIVIIGISVAQGIVTSSDDLFQYVYKDDYKIQPGTATKISSLVAIPWSLKPIWGAITDSLPIFGYRRKSYILLTCICVFTGFFAYFLTLPPVWMGLGAVFLINVGQSFMSVLGQAIIVENAQTNADGGQATEEEREAATSKAVTVYINGRNSGLLIFSGILAVFLTEDNYKTIIKFIGFTPIFVLLLSFLLKEKRIKKNKPEALMHDASHNKPENKDKLKKFLNFVKSPLIIKCWMFIFFASFQISSGSAGFYYYTLYLKFNPNTVSTVNTISLAATIAAISGYYYFFSKVSMRKFYTTTLFFVIGANLTMLILYFRLNVKWGISDFIMVVLETFIKSIVVELNSVPIWKLAAQLCPKGLEATVYAFMLAGANLAGIISGQITGLIIDLLYITNDNFDNMWILTIIGACSPLISLYFVATVPFEEAIKYASEHNAAADAVEEEEPERVKKASFLSAETKNHVLVNDS